MIYSIIIHGAPYSSQACQSALNFANAVLAGGHDLKRIFFYQDAVYAASRYNTPPEDEVDITEAFSQLAKDNQVELIACIASCLRRGILNETEADRYEKSGNNIAPCFEISGLGQMIDACLNSDRVVSFGA